MKGLQDYFLMEERPFVARREVNWKKVKIVAGIGIGIILIIIISVPQNEHESQPSQEIIRERSVSKINDDSSDPTIETLQQLRDAQVSGGRVHTSLDYLYRANPSSESIPGVATQKNARMVLTREGGDTKSQVLAGSSIKVTISTGMTLSDQSLPVIGIVSRDVEFDGVTAIQSGSKIVGDAVFDQSSERINIQWNSIILPDGRQRPISAIGLGQDGEVGIEGRVNSKGYVNAVGQTLTKFVGAYASCSMNTGAFGENKGGHANGLRSAFAQTATDRATALGEDLQKEKKWVHIKAGTSTKAVLKAPFTFRDPGSTHGQ